MIALTAILGRGASRSLRALGVVGLGMVLLVSSPTGVVVHHVAAQVTQVLTYGPGTGC